MLFTIGDCVQFLQCFVLKSDSYYTRFEHKKTIKRRNCLYWIHEINISLIIEWFLP